MPLLELADVYIHLGDFLYSFQHLPVHDAGIYGKRRCMVGKTKLGKA